MNLKQLNSVRTRQGFTWLNSSLNQDELNSTVAGKFDLTEADLTYYYKKEYLLLDKVEGKKVTTYVSWYNSKRTIKPRRSKK